LSLAFSTGLLTSVMSFALFAIGPARLVGRAGLVSFGHAAYFGLAAYTLALLSPDAEPACLWLTLPAAIAVATVAALVNGFVVLRTRGVYFMLATLTFAPMLFFPFHDTSIGGGSDGRYINFKPEAGLFDIGQPRTFYYFVLVLLIGVYALFSVLLRSSFGRALAGIKANEQRMQSLGFPVQRYK